MQHVHGTNMAASPDVSPAPSTVPSREQPSMSEALRAGEHRSGRVQPSHLQGAVRLCSRSGSPVARRRSSIAELTRDEEPVPSPAVSDATADAILNIAASSATTLRCSSAAEALANFPQLAQFGFCSVDGQTRTLCVGAGRTAGYCASHYPAR